MNQLNSCNLLQFSHNSGRIKSFLLKRFSCYIYFFFAILRGFLSFWMIIAQKLLIISNIDWTLAYKSGCWSYKLTKHQISRIETIHYKQCYNATRLHCVCVPASLAQLVEWLLPWLGGTGFESRLGWPFMSYHLILVCVNYDLNGSLRINIRLHARLNNQISHPIPCLWTTPIF